MQQDSSMYEELQPVVYSDDQSIIEANYEPQLGQEEQPTPQPEGMAKAEVGPLELIYIMFSHFRKQCDELSQKYNCVVKFSISSYIVEQKGQCSKEQFGECLTKINQFRKSISIAQLRIETVTKFCKFKYYNSPYINKLLEKKKIKLALFHQKVYGFSRELSEDVIKHELINLGKNIIIHSVSVRRVKKSIDKGSWLHQLYSHVINYVELLFTHYETFFKEREVIAMFDTSRQFVLLHGNRAKYIMEAKNTIKNVLESMVCIYLKDTRIDHKHMNKYLKKATLYPVYCAPYNESTTAVISKDNILKQLLNKSPIFMRHLGLQQAPLPSFSMSQAELEPSVGFFLIVSDTFSRKMESIKQKCQAKGYDIYSYMGIRYFKKVFIQHGKEPQEHPYRELMVDLCLTVEECKEKYEIMRPQEKETPVPKEAQDGLDYQILSGKLYNEQLSKQIKRDVMSEKVRMKKKFIIAYNVEQSTQEPAYWPVDKEGVVSNEVKPQNMKKGTYLKGRKKMNDKGQEVRMYEELITVI